MVLAEPYTPIGRSMRAVTVDTVTFERPTQIRFRLLRGPVPNAVEQFLAAGRESAQRSGFSPVLGHDSLVP